MVDGINIKIHIIENYIYGGRKLKTIAIANGEQIELLPSMFLLERAINSIAFNSIKANAEDLITFLKVVYSSSGCLKLTDISREQMDMYLYQYLAKNRNLSDKSLIRHSSTLKLFYDWLYSAGFIDVKKQFNFPKNKSFSKGTGSDVGSKYISDDEFELLKVHLNGSTPFIRERNELILDFGYYCGLRAHEISENTLFLDSNLVTQKVIEAVEKNEDSMRLLIEGKGSKTRTIIIPPLLLMKVGKYLNRRNKLPQGPLFCSKNGEKLNKQFASNVFSEAVKNLPHDKRMLFHSKSFHSLRHTFATNLVTYSYENGRDPFNVLPDLMGHADSDTTMKYIEWEAYLNNRVGVIKKLSMIPLGEIVK